MATVSTTCALASVQARAAIPHTRLARGIRDRGGSDPQEIEQLRALRGCARAKQPSMMVAELRLIRSPHARSHVLSVFAGLAGFVRGAQFERLRRCRRHGPGKSAARSR